MAGEYHEIIGKQMTADWTSETSVQTRATRCYIPDEDFLHEDYCLLVFDAV
jgi:hypothetical protein